MQGAATPVNQGKPGVVNLLLWRRAGENAAQGEEQNQAHSVAHAGGGPARRGVGAWWRRAGGGPARRGYDLGGGRAL
jgi:hypothetical protein